MVFNFGKKHYHLLWALAWKTGSGKGLLLTEFYSFGNSHNSFYAWVSL